MRSHYMSLSTWDDTCCNCLLGLKNKRFVCPFGLKIGRVGRTIFFFFFFFFNSGHGRNVVLIMCVCILGHAEPQNWFNPGGGGGVVFHYIWLWCLFGTITICERAKWVRSWKYDFGFLTFSIRVLFRLKFGENPTEIGQLVPKIQTVDGLNKQ